jgi:peroxiredoxin
MGVQIVGVGFGDPSAQGAWAEEEGFQYEVWTDQNKELSLYYGAIENESAFFPARITRLLAEDGTLLLEYNNVDFGTNPRQVLEDCQQIFMP